MCGDGIVAVRDPWGNRPLCIGAIRDPEARSVCALVGTSESCALSAMGAELWREVEPGELVLLSPRSTPPSSPNGLITLSARPESPTALCIFEFVYFARPASRIQGIEVNSVRLRCGELLAEKAGVRGADIVSNVPDSASPAAIGFAQKAGLPYRPVLSKNPYVGRTFIQPNTASRISGIKRKFSVLTEEVVGKRIVLVDDSIVRGNTMGALVKVLKASGAKEVHLRVASPPIRWPCFYGINIPARQELLAAGEEFEGMEGDGSTESELFLAAVASKLGADSVGYLPLSDLLDALRPSKDANRTPACTACLTRSYPVSPHHDIEDLPNQ